MPFLRRPPLLAHQLLSLSVGEENEPFLKRPTDRSSLSIKDRSRGHTVIRILLRAAFGIVPSKMSKKLSLSTAIVTLALVAGCSEGSGPSAAFSNVAVSFSTQPAAGTSPSGIFASGGFHLLDPLTDGAGNTLDISSAEIVLREIELERLDVPDCDVEPEPEGCVEFVVGPILVDLPTVAGVQQQVALQIPSGTYTEIEFDIHKVSSSDPADEAFLQAHGDLVDTSIRVGGTFNGQTFEFTSDLNVEQELALNLVISETDPMPTNVTIFVDLDVWFRDAAGTLVDPVSANKGGPNENLVKDNIKDSIEAFEDEDRDGRR